jgi:acetylornithine deacetylase
VEERRGEVVAFLQRLIQYDSVTGNETEVQAFIAAHLEGLALEVDQFDADPSVLRQYPGFLEPEKPMAGRPNVVGVWKGRGGGRSLLLNGHVDTVPLEPMSEWVRGPLSGELADGRVWGRPVGVAVSQDGSLFVTDDGSQSIWRVSYAGK